jgi:hypothetical protein
VATEEQANKARNKYAQALVKGGAHAIGVDKGKSGFVVVAHVAPNQAHDVPDKLSYKAGKETVEVPVVKKVTERFRPE